MINPLIYFLIFFKATLFSSGGFSNLPSVHQDLLASNWANEAEFAKSLSIGQISPGPNGLWVIALGYLSYGFLGAFLVLIAITIPPFCVLIVASVYTRLEQQRWIAGLMRGITLAVVGTFLTVFWTLRSSSATDWRSWLICAIAFALVFSRRVNILLILIMAGIAGYFIYR